MSTLTSLRLAGWKSIREAEVEFRPLNILIGANGAGKSNLVSFFKLLGEMLAGRLQVQVATAGGAEELLHFGAKRTAEIEAALTILADGEHNGYSFRLIPTAGNSLVFDEERLERHRPGDARPHVLITHAGHRESTLKNVTSPEEVSTRFIRPFLAGCRIYHFHDTSALGPMRRDSLINANQSLSADGGNLPSMLYLYRERYPTVYRRIVAAVRAVAPYFDDFVLEPLRLNPRNIALHWRARGAEYDFGPHQLSDGTLRAIALFTLLAQPEQDLPTLIVLDEPELGLHPAALTVLADLLKLAARHTQVVVATQSALLLDHFEPEDVLTANLRDGATTFERLDRERLSQWLEEYSLSELWERNVVGGGPY